MAAGGGGASRIVRAQGGGGGGADGVRENRGDIPERLNCHGRHLGYTAREMKCLASRGNSGDVCLLSLGDQSDGFRPDGGLNTSLTKIAATPSHHIPEEQDLRAHRKPAVTRIISQQLEEDNMAC
ncbi:hypothetical protein D4764_03G0008220 [Takifugu flavidus]|uniref:Uncharacterized protein n=1 Tax=Takifugu flavidus TaxID=433684 RepID=A0A5C6N8J8_9TELE|nr:hypothetical protein D4764_03G0008220 [Takifugu flavidus]